MTYWLAFTRSIHITASILLAALFAFRLIVLRPAVSRFGSIERFPSNLTGSWSRLAVASLITVIFSGLAWFALVAASISGASTILEVSPETLEIMLFHTQFGHIWLGRSGCILVLGVLLFTGRRDSIKSFFAFAILVSLAGAGHAGAKASGAGLLALAGDAGHRTAAALWPGGLVPLLFVLCRACHEKENLRFVAEVVRGFSTLSLVVVVLVATTGILNAYFIVGSLRALFETPYGRLLLFKIAVFLLMICFGALNLLVLKPRLLKVPEGAELIGVPAPVRALIKSVLCEIVLAAGVLLIIGYLGVTEPPAH